MIRYAQKLPYSATLKKITLIILHYFATLKFQLRENKLSVLSEIIE